MINKGLSRIAIFVLYLISLFPFWFLYLLSDLIFIILFYIVKYRRIVVKTNLEKSFPEKSAAERSKIEKQYFKYLADMIVESVKMITLSKEQALKHFKFVNPELLQSYYAEGKSIIAAAGHYGNWEMANVLSLYNEQNNLVIYKPLANEVFESFLKKIRSRYGAILVPMKLSLRKISEYKKHLTFYVFVSDQTPAMNETQYFTKFLNQPTAIFLGIEKIAKMTNYPVVFCDVKVVKRGHYTCTFVPLINNPKETSEHEITEAHVRYLEQKIRQEPQYWLWSHKRWKFDEEKHWIS